MESGCRVARCEVAWIAFDLDAVALAEVLGKLGAKHMSVDVRAVASDRIVDVDIHRVVVAGLELGGGLSLGAPP